MKTVIIARVHAEKENVYTSRDFNGYRNFATEVLADNFIGKYKGFSNLIKEMYVDEELGIKLMYFAPMTYNRDREFFESVFKNGFSKLSDMYWNRQEELKNEKRKKDGFVIYTPLKKRKVKDYIGSLNKSMTPFLKKYLYKGCGGYLGHSVRKFSHDKIVERAIDNARITLDGKQIDKWQVFSVWLTSTDARHFMDLMEDKDLEEFQNEFMSYVPDALFRGFIYDLDEHGGMLKDTISLTKQYQDRVVIGEK